MKHLGRCQLMQFDLVCAKLAWLGVSQQVQVAERLAGAYFWASSGGLSALPFCSSSIPALLPLPGIWTNRVLGLKVIYLSAATGSPSALVSSREACSVLPARLSLKDDPWTCLPVSAVHNKWGMNQQLRLWGGKWSQKWRKGEIQANLLPILKSHMDTLQTLPFIYMYSRLCEKQQA